MKLDGQVERRADHLSPSLGRMNVENEKQPADKPVSFEIFLKNEGRSFIAWIYCESRHRTTTLAGQYADDVASYAIFQVLQRWSTIKGSPYPYASKIIRRRASRFRSQASSDSDGAMEKEIRMDGARATSILEEEANREERVSLRRACMCLSDPERAVLGAISTAGSLRKAAMLMDMPSSSLRRKYHKIVQELQRFV